MQSINAPQNVVYIYKYSCQNMLSSNSSQIYPPTKSSIFFTFKNTRNQNNPILINTHFPTFQIIPALQATKMPKSFTRFPSSSRSHHVPHDLTITKTGKGSPLSLRTHKQTWSYKHQTQFMKTCASCITTTHYNPNNALNNSHPFHELDSCPTHVLSYFFIFPSLNIMRGLSWLVFSKQGT